MYDTGADITVISFKLFEQLKNRPKLEQVKFRVSGAGDSPLDMAGHCILTLEIKGVKKQQKVHVCRKLKQNAILGIDAMAKWGLNFCVKERKFKIEKDISLIEKRISELENINYFNQMKSVAPLTILSTEIL